MIANFKIESEYQPSGDQPEAIKALAGNIKSGKKFQTLLGATGTGKTFSVAQVIQKIQKPTLVMAPNKTLAAQLYNELKELFPENAVHYFVSYYDYYQPEAYLPVTGLYIEKDFSVNEEIERLRLAATHAIRTRNDVIIVATVSCIYGIGDPKVWTAISLNLDVGQTIQRREIIKRLILMNYERKDIEFKPGTVRVKGDIIDIFPAYLNNAIRISLFGEVQLVAILDADKLGFLRDTRLLIQTIGRASRNIDGRAILYADKITRAMKEAIEETNRRRKKQRDYNEKFKITPQTVKKIILNSLSGEKEFKEREVQKLERKVKDRIEVLERQGDEALVIEYLENKMFLAAKELRFEDAAYLRDKIKEIKKDYKIKA